MRELMLACIALFAELLVFLSAGSLLLKKWKMKMELSMALILGYILYFSVFGIIMIPLTLCWVSLSAASICWAILCALVILGAVILWRKHCSAALNEVWKEHGLLLLVVLGVVGIQCLFVALYQDMTVDATYYVGHVSTSVYTDTLQRYDPYTGAIFSNFNARYVFSSYPMHNAVWCRLIGLHPLVQSKVVMAVINVLTANCVIYQLSKRLFDGQKRSADLMVCFVAFLQLFSYTIYTPGTFFFTRTYEGKAILANISLVLVFYCCIWFWQNQEDNRMWWVLLLTNISAVTFSGSAIIMPAAVSAATLPLIIKRRQFSKISYYLLAMLPSILYGAVYLGAKFGIFVFPAS